MPSFYDLLVCREKEFLIQRIERIALHAFFEPDAGKRELAVHDLYRAHRRIGARLLAGFIGDNQLFVACEIGRKQNYVYISDVPARCAGNHGFAFAVRRVAQ